MTRFAHSVVLPTRLRVRLSGISVCLYSDASDHRLIWRFDRIGHGSARELSLLKELSRDREQTVIFWLF